jgi:hypothetical protein
MHCPRRKTESAGLCTKYDITAYPTVKLFTKGAEPELYGGARAVDSFVSYAHNAVSGGKVWIVVLGPFPR